MEKYILHIRWIRSLQVKNTRYSGHKSFYHHILRFAARVRSGQGRFVADYSKRVGEKQIEFDQVRKAIERLRDYSEIEND